MKYLCLDMTGQCVMRVEGRRLNGPRMSSRLRFPWCQQTHQQQGLITKQLGEMRKKAKHTVGLCMCPPIPSPFVLRLFLKVDLMLSRDHGFFQLI